MAIDSGSMHAYYAMLCRLSNPTATLYGYDANNTGHAIVLSLASPSASPADKVRCLLTVPTLCMHHLSRVLYSYLLLNSVSRLLASPASISEVAGFPPVSGPIRLTQLSWSIVQGRVHAFICGVADVLVMLQSVTFNVAILTDATAIKTGKGVANEEFEASANEAGYLLTSVQPGTEMYDVALFIDVNNESVQPEATTKDWYR